ncbi:DEAD/DEAH box helicase family protein [Rhodococcoides fascians A25f]|uniref:DEAD/DEAH box helicase n=1 Tax=Rhodococcoides fascians TaxID=1828 RepID=UPI0009B8FAE3|nr:DEAD/DEAH box helicase [Rhodococcus fascians]QII07817.1 DEAD/DEAH box helicase family protein [Rhodococcus fascians A25f]
MGTFATLYGNLSKDNHIRGRQFERICKWYVENDAYYRQTVRNVWLWDDWEHRWGSDSGIDLVVEDNEGKLWAVQAKAYASDRAVTKNDVDKFLSESSRRRFHYRLLIATTDRIHHVARRTIDAQEKPVGLIGLAYLQTADIDWAESPDLLHPIPSPQPALPRDHQTEAVDNVVDGFQNADRGQLVMACGTGKTLTSLFIKQELHAQRTLVLLPSLSLLKQTMAVWRTNATEPFEALPVCSDETVTQDDAALTSTSELCLPVQNDPAEIAEFLQRSGPRVVFSTYQSSPQIAKAFTLGQVPHFDLAIADESHRVAGDESTVFATILDSNAIAARRRLFMTATPRYYTGRVLTAARGSEMEVASMDDATKFGEVFHRLSFGEAIRRGLLTDYQVTVVGVDNSTFREWATNGVLVRREEQSTDARTLASQIGLAKAMRKYDLRRVISFHSRVLRARRFAAEMPEILEWMPEEQRPPGALWTGFASGEMSSGERHVRLQRLRHLDDDERGLLTNARCLGEGVDVPTLDGIAFIDPRGSEVDIVQAVGRAIRLAENKTVGTIVIPVFIDTAADPETALKDSSFKSVWRVVIALRSHDEQMAQQIDEMRRELGRTGGRARIPDKIHLDVAHTVGKAFVDAFDVRLIEKTSAPWHFWYGMLEQYAADKGTSRVAVDYVVDGYALGQWASVQRIALTNKTLSDDRRSALDRLPGWAWDVLADQWSTWIQLMEQFVAEHGHADVPFPYAVGDSNLRSWVATQRGLHKRGRLSEERTRELEALAGWVWDTREDTWARNYQALKAFAARMGRAQPSPRLVEDGVRLGQWVAAQRTNRDDLSSERVRLLEALPGWSWAPQAEKWDRGYKFLTAFVAREGHARVPNTHVENGFRLGKWVTVQRGNQRNLSASDLDRLQSLPGWVWDSRAAMWQQKLELLRQYQRREGHALVPQGFKEDGVQLGGWVLAQRNNRASIVQERREHLEAVPGWSWDPYTDAWDRAYAALVSYAEQHGHTRVSRGHIADGVNLGGWVGEQRGNWAKMTEDRRQRLEAVPGWSWNTLDDSWTQHLELLRSYARREGHTSVPVDFVEDGLKIGQWARLRRREHTRLDSDRQAQLEAIPGWFWGTKSDHIWNQKFEMLEQYVAREGHIKPPDDHVEKGVKLGAWVREQWRGRENIKAERSAKLETLPGWSWETG